MKLLPALFILLAFTANAQQVIVTGLTCEGKADPLGIDRLQPSLSWQLQSGHKNVLQQAYRIMVGTDSVLLLQNKGIVWDTRKIMQNASLHIAYKGGRLQAAKKYYWKVMVWDNYNNNSAWSAVSSWQMGLLTESDWANAAWIAYDTLPEEKKIVPAAHGNGDRAWGARKNILPLFRREFATSQKIKNATAFICGLGHFEMSINGKKVGDHFLDAGWTNFEKSVIYVTFNIKPYLQQGNNTVGVMLGNGFYYVPGERYRKLTGAFGYPKMIARLLIEYEDGTVQNIVSDPGWKTAPSPIYFSSIYGGEDYDATREHAGWDVPGFVENDAWKNAILTTGHPLQAQVATPVKLRQQFTPVSVKKITDSLWVYDMGQNMSGIPAIKLTGSRGDTVKITCAELLTDEGLANQVHTGRHSYFTYVLKDSETEEAWMPRFMYYGFRYIQVALIKQKQSATTVLPMVKEITAWHCRNSAASAGNFNTSFELFNKTHRLILWAINSNMQSIFTDCPHREKLGWQEEVYLVGNSIQYNYNIQPLSEKIFRDIKNQQMPDGLVPSVVPEYTVMTFANGYFRDSPEWGSNAIIFPWYIYNWYGNKRVLEENYEVMQRYIQYLKFKDSSGLLMYGLSDWYDLGKERPGFCQLTPMGLTATATYYYNLTILQKIADLLGKPRDEKIYRQWAVQVKNAFNKMYFNSTTKNYGSGSQTSNAMPLYMGLVPQQYQKAVLDNLVADIRKNNYSITTGDIGYRYLLKVLDNAGRSDIIYNINSRTDVPGYGYQIERNATALTESWQALPTVSNNHLMLGHLMEWFYEGLAGIKQANGSIGYKNTVIQPQPVGNIQKASATYHSPYGTITVNWEQKDKIFNLQVNIPANTTATIIMPGNNTPIKTGSGEYRYTVSLK